MLTHPIHEQLRSLRLTGMARAFEEQLAMPDMATMSFEDRLGLMVAREATERASRRLSSRLRTAKLRQSACVEDLDLRRQRGLDRALILELASCHWVRHHHNVLITGPTGIGKSFIACALAHKACLEGFTAFYAPVPKLFRELAAARGDGRHGALLERLARIDVLVLDDWGLAAVGDGERRDLYELLDDRHERRSTIVTSQLPVDEWHRVIGDPTLADAILDRLTSNAYRIVLDGPSIRPKRPTRPGADAEVIPQ
jgi:DNA replication protein DnaC